MKAIQSNTFTRGIYAVVIILLSTLLLQSCSRKVSFQTSQVVPAAEGSVKVKKDNNNNYKIDLKLVRLADPKRLSPSKEMYVVWMKTERNGTKNIGRLETSSGFLSKTLKSSLETVTSFKPTQVFITAEDNASVQYPAGQVVLATGNF